MKRYLSSLSITLFIYAGAVILAVILFADDALKSQSVQSENRVLISLLSQEKVLTKSEPYIEKTDEKKIQKNEQKKENIKKEPVTPKKLIEQKQKMEEVPYPQRVAEPEQKLEPEQKKQPVETEKAEDESNEISEPKKQKSQKKPTDEVLAKNDIKAPKEKMAVQNNTKESRDNDIIMQDQLASQRDLFLAKLVEQINKNKSYPNIARRRAIEGEVKIQFKVMANGSVNNIEFISGRGVFKRSAISAIENSFPIEIDEKLFEFPKEFAIKISYILR